jgi:hypothetical protein
MAEILIEGVNLGYTEKAYDFVDEGGERRQGVSQRLHLLVDTEVIEVRVPDERVAEARAVPLKTECTVRVNVPKSVKPTLVEHVA